ncbi:hypothetical protein LOZ39_004894 [Ophidiomyces ophidiicola]|nr:hypothetical protein LOZ59_006727 [Ophidiomyces ophidiicola]KAI2015996.1 hypothetical protein LOZ45_006700 [Ophidiomyces ophidiicola]KAI2040788.1 hypothetical protein LOZ44_006624 [Ophidiomyces ophidiicola]KAI2070600.1 hypothetical protein LOZ39_004894 [Ophidiomyces ophidiicola]KAI2106726.1 hypothetical protein LOZ42_006517 [Ophidiomyces ophidiicola]
MHRALFAATRRQLSTAASPRSFPATLHRLQHRRESRLYDKQLRSPADLPLDAVLVSHDGLVQPGTRTRTSPGAVFMPNTFYMQELTRTAFDEYIERAQASGLSAALCYLTIPKGKFASWETKGPNKDSRSTRIGTPIPPSLALVRERSARFSLQPAQPVSLSALNAHLTAFYAECGVVTPAGEWMEKNAYDEAFDDDAEDWMEH